MSPTSAQAERWLAKAGERSGANHPTAAPGSVNSRRSVDLRDSYQHNVADSRDFGDDYRSRGSTGRYPAADTEVRPRATSTTLASRRGGCRKIPPRVSDSEKK